jgi:PAS domain S-box-containing protein
MLDERGRITFWNRAAEDLFGYDASEVLGRVLHDFLAPERFLAQHRAAFPSWQASGQGQAIGTTVEFAAIRKDSKEITIELSLSSVKVRDRWHAIGIIRDVGARKQAERDLLEAKQAAEAASGKLELANVQLEAAARTARESTAQAESANAAKGEFLARMSHEIRTPMNAIIGMTGLLLDTPLAAEQREYAGIVRTSADALLVIVNDILDFSKIEAGKLDMESIDFHLHDLVEETTRMFAVKAQEKGLRLTCVLAADVPARLRGDPGRLRQILLNLIGNAIKFTARGEVAIRVALDAQDDARATLRFTVRDTGIGIPADGIASLFQSFSQVDSSITRRFGGTGLGLAVSRSLVALMGGQIGVESAPNDGSTFWFTAVFEKQGMTTASPAAPAPSAAALATGDATGAPSERPRMPTTSPSSVGDRGRPLRALVTDDNVVNQKVAVGLLRRLGFRADAAGSGAEALAALDTTPYDLVLMDVQMPEMDGFAVTRAIRQREAATGRHLPVIAMTAHAMTGDRERCLAEGMDGYVSKPIDRAQMATALEALPGMPVRSAVEVPTPVSPPAEVFNRHELVARLGGDEPLVVEVIDAFLEDAPGIRSELARATAAGEVQTLTRLGHLLKGSSATLGAHALRISAAELERVGRAGDVKQSQAQASVVDREYDRLIHVLSATDVTS